MRRYFIIFKSEFGLYFVERFLEKVCPLRISEAKFGGIDLPGFTDAFVNYCVAAHAKRSFAGYVN